MNDDFKDMASNMFPYMATGKPDTPQAAVSQADIDEARFFNKPVPRVTTQPAQADGEPKSDEERAAIRGQASITLKNLDSL